MWLSLNERQENSACHSYLEKDHGLKLLNKDFTLAPSLRGMSAACDIRLHCVEL